MIKEFQGGYKFLSNFWLCDIVYEGMRYHSVEHAYQVAKFSGQIYGPEIQEEIRNAVLPGEAKRIGKKNKYLVRKDWEQVNLGIMEVLVRQKFTKFPALRKLLLETGNEYLQEGNWWNDEFYGYSFRSKKGLNHLGNIIMKVRDEIRKEGDKKMNPYEDVDSQLDDFDPCYECPGRACDGSCTKKMDE